MQQQQDTNDESWLEEQCYREINAQHDEHERVYVHQRENSLSTAWNAFQDSATAVAYLYRERSNAYPDTGALWLPFQTAAGTVTTLYKESCEGVKRTSDAAIQSGYHKRTRELADWARSKKRRMIRRDDLLAYLAGKLPPMSATHVNRRSPKPEHANNTFPSAGLLLPPAVGGTAIAPNHNHSHNAHQHHHHHHHQHQVMPANEAANDLHTFREALVRRPRGPELFAFVANEITRHCKRPASPIDDKMDVCHYNSKRQRFM